MAKSVGKSKEKDNKDGQFKKDSREFKKLLMTLKEGKAKFTEKPVSVKNRYPKCFGRFTTTQFRSQWNVAKNVLGANCKWV